MRFAYLALLIAACGTEEGTLLTVRAPDGPGAVARLEIVLANASVITELENQRVAPTMLDGERVRYYRQRATAGYVDGIGNVDGFTIRIEPNIAEVPEKTFIPFLVAYDRVEQVIGVGAVFDLEGQPATIDIRPQGTVQYLVDMVPLAPMDLAGTMGARQSLRVTCDDGWTSGVAWRPATTQFRLLLAEAGLEDATERDADLDCDGFVAARGDCDDLRSTFHAGMAEQCDGFDSNCDAARTAVQSCAHGQCGSGVQLCDDRTGTPIGACVANATCACETGNCTECTLAYRATSVNAQAPCAPGVGKLHFPACTETTPCAIEVLGSSPWVGYLGTALTGPFSTKLTVTQGYAYIEAKGPQQVQAQQGNIGALNLAITQSGLSRLVPVALFLAEAPTTQCPAISGTNTFAMSCSP